MLLTRLLKVSNFTVWKRDIEGYKGKTNAEDTITPQILLLPIHLSNKSEKNETWGKIKCKKTSRTGDKEVAVVYWSVTLEVREMNQFVSKSPPPVARGKGRNVWQRQDLESSTAPGMALWCTVHNEMRWNTKPTGRGKFFTAVAGRNAR